MIPTFLSSVMYALAAASCTLSCTPSKRSSIVAFGVRCRIDLNPHQTALGIWGYRFFSAILRILKLRIWNAKSAVISLLRLQETSAILYFTPTIAPDTARQTTAPPSQPVPEPPPPPRNKSGAGCHCRSSSGARYLPVKLRSTSTTCSGFPSATISPPRTPPSGPRSMIQSAVLITSRLCSITTTELP